MSRVTDTLWFGWWFSGAKERREESGGHGRIERDLERRPGMPAAGNRGTGVGRFRRVKGGISTIGKELQLRHKRGMDISRWVFGRRGGIILNGWDGRGVGIPFDLDNGGWTGWMDDGWNGAVRGGFRRPYEAL